MSQTNPFYDILSSTSPVENGQIFWIADLELVHGLSADELEYLTEVGLIPPIHIEDGELPSSIDLDRLRIIIWARSCLFSVEDTKQILALYDNEDENMDNLKLLIAKQVVRLDFEIREREDLTMYLRKIRDGMRL